jgi:hypothetical protein
LKVETEISNLLLVVGLLELQKSSVHDVHLRELVEKPAPLQHVEDHGCGWLGLGSKPSLLVFLLHIRKSVKTTVGLDTKSIKSIVKPKYIPQS